MTGASLPRGRGVAAALAGVLRVAYWVGVAALAAGIATTLFYVVTALTGGGFSTGLVSADVDRENWQAIAPGFAVWIVFSAAVVLITSRLRRVFDTLAAGDPFVPENAGRIRQIAWTLAGVELLRYAIQAGTALIIGLFGHPADGKMDVGFNASIPAWVAVFVLLALAQVFDDGARLRRDQSLTI